MKRFPILGALLLIPAVLLFGMVGCSPAKKDDPKKTDGDGATKTTDGAGTKKKKEDITTALEGTVKGRVKFKGTAAEPKPNPDVAKHDDSKKGFCGVPAVDQLEQTWLISKDGGVEGVVISLEPPADKKFKITDKLKEDSKKETVLDQPFCNFVPHVVGLWPDAQTLVAKNSAKVNHNVKIERGAELGAFNKTLAPGDSAKPEMKGATGVVSATCDIHGWMSAKIAVFNHPYFAVTDKDGNFEIKNVPVDVELTVKMWHESTGKAVEAQKLTAKKGNQELKLEISK